MQQRQDCISRHYGFDVDEKFLEEIDFLHILTAFFREALKK
jgi:hypothetical protein